MTLLFVAFVAGLLTILAPCTLPLLPVIVGGSVSGQNNTTRALIIALSLGASVFIFTLLLKVSTLFVAVPQSVWQIISGGLLIIFGLVTLFPKLWDNFALAGKLNLSSNRLLATGYTKKSFTGDIIMGAALGPVFSSCSPTYFIVLATVLPVHPTEGIVYLAAYCMGLILSLLGVSIVGQRIVGALGIASNPEGWFKRAVGGLFLLIGLVVVTGYLTPIESAVLSHAGIFDVTKIEQRLLGSSDSSTGSSTQMLGLLSLEEKASHYQLAPELVAPDSYLNTPSTSSGQAEPISLAQLKGNKVVLIDFWTYSCINCLRTIPYLNAWYEKYKDQGLVIIGVHTPEFAFEHVQSNVSDAMVRLGIKYPVVQDNEYKTWNAFGNQYWPNEYLVDIDGYVVHNHAGEGGYEETEAAIQQALAERAARLGTSATPSDMLEQGSVRVQGSDLSGIGSPETYFGYNRNEYFGNGTYGQGGTHTYTLPAQTSRNSLYLNGTWTINAEYAESQGAGDIQYTYSAKDVYFVSSAAVPVKVEVWLDGAPIGAQGGDDVNKSTSVMTIGSERLYHLVHMPSSGTHRLQIKVPRAGLRAYTFTFG